MALLALAEQVEAERVVGLLLELELAAVLEEVLELVRLVLAERIEGSFHLFFLDQRVFCGFVFTVQTLPGQRSAQEI